MEAVMENVTDGSIPSVEKESTAAQIMAGKPESDDVDKDSSEITTLDEARLVAELTETFMLLSERVSGFLSESQSKIMSAKGFDQLSKMVNSYPTVRGFTAIGTGGEDFVQAMVVAVETVLDKPIPQGQVKQKISSGGKYVSVNIGPVQVVSSEQVQAVYNAMRRDDRMK